jgi:uncharacterized membrane protein
VTHALLLTDVVDSTKLAEALGDARMAEVWARHDTSARLKDVADAPATTLGTDKHGNAWHRDDERDALAAFVFALGR